MSQVPPDPLSDPTPLPHRGRGPHYTRSGRRRGPSPSAFGTGKASGPDARDFGPAGTTDIVVTVAVSARVIERLRLLEIEAGVALLLGLARLEKEQAVELLRLRRRAADAAASDAAMPPSRGFLRRQAEGDGGEVVVADEGGEE